MARAAAVSRAGDARMRHGRAHEGQEELARGRHVVGEAALAGDQRRVLDAAHGLAAAEALGLERRVHRLICGSGQVSAACCTAATMLT
jgi:hypothetical protein